MHHLFLHFLLELSNLVADSYILIVFTKDGTLPPLKWVSSYKLQVSVYSRRRRTALSGFCPDLLCGVCRSKSSSNSKSGHSKTLPTENFRFWRTDTVQLTRTESGQRCPPTSAKNHFCFILSEKFFKNSLVKFWKTPSKSNQLFSQVPTNFFQDDGPLLTWTNRYRLVVS